MNWLKRRLRNWVNNTEDEMVSNRKVNRGLTVSADSEGLNSEPLRLSIYRANGGTVVETRQYDRLKDRNQNHLHIISHDDNLGESLAKIIMMESLRA